MLAAKHIVEQIKAFLDTGNRDVSVIAEVARDYAARCEAVNDLLRRCEAYLDRDMWAEAVHLAESPPPVLSLAAVMDFDGVETWRSLCMENGLTAPAPILEGVVSRLNEAYGREASLSDLLRVYRRVARTGTLSQMLSVLRRIASAEPDNVSWREDLKSFERARLTQILEEIRSGQPNDLEGLESLRTDLGSPAWTDPSREKVLERVEQLIHELRATAGLDRARQLSAELWDAYNALDYERTRTLLAAWQSLENDGDFEAPRDLTNEVEEVREWFEREDRKRKDDVAFEKALRELTSALDDPAQNREDVSRLVFTLNQFNREVPEHVRVRAERALQDAALAEKRRFVLKLALIGIVVAAVGLPAFILATVAIRKRTRMEWTTRIEETLSAGQYESASKLCAELAHEHPGMSKEPALQELATRVTTAQGERRKEQETLTRLLSQLEEIRKTGFPADRPYAEIEALAARLSRSDAERARLQEWQAVRQAYEDQRQQDIDSSFSIVLQRAANAFSSLEERDPEKDPDPYAEILEGIEQSLQQAERMGEPSAPLKVQLLALKRNHIAHTSLLRTARGRLRKQADLLTRLDNTPDSLEEYEALLTTFTQEFPKHARSAGLRKILGACRLGEELERSLTGMWEHNEAAAAEAKTFLEDPQSKASLWYDWVDRFHRQWQCIQATPAVLKRFAQLSQNRRLSGLCIVSHEGKEYYCLDAPRRISTTTVDGKRVHSYKAQVLTAEEEPETKLLTVTSPHAPDTLEAQPAPHCMLFKDTVWRLDSASPENCELILLDGAERARRDPRMDPVLKVILMRQFIEQAIAMTLDSANQLQAVMRALDAFNTNLYWMDPNPSAELVQERRAIVRTLSKMDDIKKAIHRRALSDRLFGAASARNVRYAGRVGADGKTLRLRRNSPPELWIVQHKANGAPAVLLAAVRDEQGKVVWDSTARECLFPGQPVFGPTDGMASRVLLERLLHDASCDGLGEMDEMRWPRLWPLNARGLSRNNGAE